MEASATKLEVVQEYLGGDVGVYGIGMTELVDPCVLDGIDDEDAETMFGGFMELEIVPHQLVEGLGSVADDGSGVVWNSWVDGGPCGKYKRRVVLRNVIRVGE